MTSIFSSSPGRGTLAALALVVLCCTAAAQLPTATATPAQPQTPLSSTPQFQSLGQSQNPFFGGVPSGQVVPGVLHLGLLDALDRGLRNNLGVLLSADQSESARGARWRELSNLLPHVTTRTGATRETLNLVALGFNPALFGVRTSVGPVVGPFNVVDTRAFLTDTALSIANIEGARSASQNLKAAEYTAEDAREIVVLVVGGTYLQATASASRVDAAQAQFNTADQLYRQAMDMRRAGVIAGIDVLRAQVQMQSQQQRLLSAQNQFEKDKLTLARVIGLPVAQQFDLADKVPFAPAPELNLEEALQRAYSRRRDYQAALARVVAAEMNRRSAYGEALPSIEFNGDYGYIGPDLGSMKSTYTIAAGLRIPIFQGGKVKGDVLQADALLRQRRQEAADLRSRIEFEVRSALLDVKTAADQVAVAQQAVTLAHDQLKQSQDRFAAGVADNLEVVQAQQAVAEADENYIAALNTHNISKLALARALGVVEQQTKKFLEGGK